MRAHTPSKPWFNPLLTPAQRINRIGEEVYVKIRALWETERATLPSYIHAGKITGMIVELPLEEVDALLDNDAALTATYEKAKKVLIDAHERPTPSAK